MDVRQIKNIITIEEEKSISRAAEKLYMTQSALNQQLLRLERELGVALFNRGSRSLTPTYAGRVYLDAARKMLDIRNETYKILHDISNVKRGEIAITYTPERGSRMFSAVYPKFHAMYPEMTFKIYEARVKRMEQLLERHEVSIAFLAYTDKDPRFDYIDMQKEQMVLGIPANHPLAHLAGERSWERLPKINLRLLENDYFVLITHETLMRDMCDKAFSLAGFKPNVLFESTSTITVVNMVRNQVAPAFFPQSYVDPEAPIMYFSIDPPFEWTLTATTYKGAYLNRAERDFIELTRIYHFQEGKYSGNNA
ncbi:MAG: LysR family transcriptional regulator [Oscillospiraceae bacterium]